MPLAHKHPCQKVHCLFTSGPIHQALVHAQAGHSQLPAGLFPAVPLAQSASLVFSDRFWRCDSLAQKAREASACLEPLHICPLASMEPASVISKLAYREGSLLISQAMFVGPIRHALIMNCDKTALSVWFEQRYNGVVQSQHQVQCNRSESSTVRWCGYAMWAYVSVMDKATGCCQRTLHGLQVLKMGCRQVGSQTAPE